MRERTIVFGSPTIATPLNTRMIQKARKNKKTKTEWDPSKYVPPSLKQFLSSTGNDWNSYGTRSGRSIASRIKMGEKKAENFTDVIKQDPHQVQALRTYEKREHEIGKLLRIVNIKVDKEKEHSPDTGDKEKGKEKAKRRSKSEVGIKSKQRSVRDFSRKSEAVTPSRKKHKDFLTSEHRKPLFEKGDQLMQKQCMKLALGKVQVTPAGIKKYFKLREKGFAKDAAFRLANKTPCRFEMPEPDEFHKDEVIPDSLTAAGMNALETKLDKVLKDSRKQKIEQAFDVYMDEYNRDHKSPVLKKNIISIFETEIDKLNFDEEDSSKHSGNKNKKTTSTSPSKTLDSNFPYDFSSTTTHKMNANSNQNGNSNTNTIGLMNGTFPRKLNVISGGVEPLSGDGVGSHPGNTQSHRLNKYYSADKFINSNTAQYNPTTSMEKTMKILDKVKELNPYSVRLPFKYLESKKNIIRKRYTPVTSRYQSTPRLQKLPDFKNFQHIENEHEIKKEIDHLRDILNKEREQKYKMKMEIAEQRKYQLLEQKSQKAFVNNEKILEKIRTMEKKRFLKMQKELVMKYCYNQSPQSNSPRMSANYMPKQSTPK